MTWSVDFARMVYSAAINTRWESAAFRRLMEAVDASRRKGKR